MKLTISKALIIISLSLFLFEGFSQSISELDERNGFKEIKLGSHFLDYPEGELERYPGSNNDYMYMGTCCKTVFDKEVNGLMLSFDGEMKLEQILIDVPVSPDKDVTALAYNFYALFGKPTAVSNNSDARDEIYIWKGEITYLSLYLKPLEFSGFYRPVIIVGRASNLGRNKSIEDGF